MEQGTDIAQSGRGAALLQRWRWALAAAGGLALYALAGFLLAPWLIQRELPAMVRAAMGREAGIERVEVNPFALTLRLQGLRIRDHDGSLLAGLDELFANFEASSLFRRAYTFSELRIEAPYLKVVRDRTGAINLLNLAAPEPAGAGPGGMPRLVIGRLRIGRGVVDVTDQVPATAFRTRVGPFGVALDELSTLPDAAGRHEVAITLESGTQIAVRGDLVVNPLRAAGSVTVRGPFLGLASRYLKDELPFEVAGGVTDVALRFVLQATPDGGLEAAVDDLAARVSGVELGAPAAPGFLGWSELRVTGGRLRWPARQLEAGSVQVSGLRVKARRAPDGAIDVVDLLAPADAGEPGAPAPPSAADAGPAWTVRIAEAGLQDMSVEFTDATARTPAAFAVTDLDLTVRNAGNEPGARMPVECVATMGGGTLRLTGELTALPDFALDAEVQAEGLALAAAQPYLSDLARVEVRGGTLALDGHLQSNATEPLAFDGDLRIRELDSYDTLKKERLLAWRELGVDDLQLSLAGNGARIARVRLEQPFGRIFIARDQSTNVGDLLVEPAAPAAVASAPAAAPAAAAPFRLRIGEVRVRRGEVDFTDLSLPLPFAARVQDLKGEFTTIDSRSSAPSRIRLEGRVDDYGLAQVNGQVRVSAPTDLADIGVVFRNIEMAPLSPYTVKFAGRKIARGKINLDLRYQLDERRMVGSNKVVIDELELGEKVPNPDAVDLPLGLAVALLKDADGRIDIDMPVSGSLDDPQFGIGSVLWKAFVNLVTRVVTSPFRLLGGLIGVESEELGRIDFPPGRAELLPPEQEKLLRVGEALARRPELAVEVPAVVDPEADAAALRAARLDARVEQELAATGRPESGRGLEKRTRQVIEAMYEQQFPGQPLAQVQQRFQAPPPDDPQGRPRLDELAYLDQLRAELAAAQSVDAAELAALGAARAAAIRAQLTTAGQVAPDRVRPGPQREGKARDGAWIGAELGVSGAAD